MGSLKKELLLLLHDYLVSVAVRARLSFAPAAHSQNHLKRKLKIDLFPVFR
jgi:hypothetical protein